MAHLFDKAYPNSGPDPSPIDGHLAYIGGDTPHVWTDAEIKAAPGRYLLPTYVRSNPQNADPVGDAGQAIAWLRAHGAPRGIVICLDLETAINPTYVTKFGEQIHAAGYLVWNYGSKSTLFQNPKLDGYFVADYTGVDHVVSGTVATQYADEVDHAYDLDDVAVTSVLWDTTTNASPAQEAAMNAPVVAGFATLTGDGYYLIGADGGVFTHGDAVFYGSCGSVHLNAPAVAAAVTPTGKGYWIACADGGVFTFGDAKFCGSHAGKPLNKPVCGFAPTPTGQGYWLFAQDGGVFTYGDAQFDGSGA